MFLLKIQSFYYSAFQYARQHKWSVSYGISLILTLGAIAILIPEYYWGQPSQREQYSSQSIDSRPIRTVADFNDFRAKIDRLCQLPKEIRAEKGYTWCPPDGQIQYIPTGFFIQSIDFINSSDVHITGYIWQKTPEGVVASENEESTCKFIFPDTVYSPDYLLIEKRDNPNSPNTTLCYFEAALRENFDYGKYPFDRKIVWIRVWTGNSDFLPVLKPAFEDYELTPTTERGQILDLENTPLPIEGFIDPEAVIPGEFGKPEDIYFSYRQHKYLTTMGLVGCQKGDIEVGCFEKDHPELYFNIVLRRNPGTALFLYGVPLVVTAMVLCATLMMLVKDQNLAQQYGLDTFGILGVCVSLFFALLISQAQIRVEFSGPLVYIEQLYTVMYVTISLVAVDAYLFFKDDDDSKFNQLVRHRDNLYFKLFYWPFICSCFFLTTFWYVYLDRNFPDRDFFCYKHGNNILSSVCKNWSDRQLRERKLLPADVQQPTRVADKPSE